jgi:hypothetical protein
MDNAILAAIKGNSVSYRCISLKSDNYKFLTIGGEIFDSNELSKVETVLEEKVTV